MMYSDRLMRKENSMFFLFGQKKRLEEDARKAEKVERIVKSTDKQIDKTTKDVIELNKTLSKVDVYDMAEKIYYATRRDA